MSNKALAYAESIAMSDGRIVDFPAGRQTLKSSYVDSDGAATVRVDFRSGVTRTIKVREDMLAAFATLGVERRVGDVTRGLSSTDEAVAALDRMIERWRDGRW